MTCQFDPAANLPAPPAAKDLTHPRRPDLAPRVDRRVDAHRGTMTARHVTLAAVAQPIDPSPSRRRASAPTQPTGEPKGCRSWRGVRTHECVGRGDAGERRGQAW